MRCGVQVAWCPWAAVVNLFVLTQTGTLMATKHNSVSLMKADDTEPIFVLRAQDTLAAAVVRFWADEAEKAGSNPAKIAEAREVADAMEQWPTRKVPD